MPRKIKVWLMAVAALGVMVVLASWLFRPRVEMWPVGVHQRSVTRSLRAWGTEYASVTNEGSARAAAGMVGYMSQYYVPGPGYHGPPKIEAALEAQRAESINRVAEALQRYTGLDYGTSVERWSEWAESREKGMGGAGH